MRLHLHAEKAAAVPPSARSIMIAHARFPTQPWSLFDSCTLPSASTRKRITVDTPVARSTARREVAKEAAMPPPSHRRIRLTLINYAGHTTCRRHRAHASNDAGNVAHSERTTDRRREPPLDAADTPTSKTNAPTRTRSIASDLTTIRPLMPSVYINQPRGNATRPALLLAHVTHAPARLSLAHCAKSCHTMSRRRGSVAIALLIAL